MRRLRALFRTLSKQRKFSVSDPKSFEEIWSVNSNGIRVLSLLIIVVLIFAVPLALLFSSGGGYFSTNDTSIERDQLEEQSAEIIRLSEQIAAQEQYLSNVRRILSGEIPVDTPLDSLMALENEMDLDSIETEPTTSEKRLGDKIRHDMSTDDAKQDKLILFGSPVTGVVSQKYDRQRHPGIDIVTEPDRAVKACLAGTVIYSGYTRKDGYIVIIDHGNGFLSVYKHNKRSLKSVGAKVRVGDPIAIVGNTGENSSGPHLHFELWLDQTPVNPQDYISFRQ